MKVTKIPKYLEEILVPKNLENSVNFAKICNSKTVTNLDVTKIPKNLGEILVPIMSTIDGAALRAKSARI